MDNNKIKCVVWDLDNTIWDGTILEGNVKLSAAVVDVINKLDERGILQSIASKNEYSVCKEKLKEYKLWDFFLYPQINWNAKSQSILNIAKSLNISTNTFAFIDDEEFERKEVEFTIPDIVCINSENIQQILDMPSMNPNFITCDSQNRRKMYMEDFQRKCSENSFSGTKEEFLATLKMKFKLSYASSDDLKRVEELTVRTHQLNSTGYTYSYEQLDNFMKQENYKLIVASLEDIYGDYGKIGICLIECSKKEWVIKLLLMSCRVMSRGVGAVFLNEIIRMAAQKKVRLKAEFLPNEKNRIMYITYRFSDFKEIEKCEDGLLVLENTFENMREYPKYVQLISSL